MFHVKHKRGDMIVAPFFVAWIYLDAAALPLVGGPAFLYAHPIAR